jgi:calcineurin-like phosphoesterase family protein
MNFKDMYGSADWHLAHRHITTYEPSRPENYEELLVENHRRILTPDSIWFFVGDMSFGKKDDREKHAEWIRSIPGRKFAVQGNHDKQSFLRKCGFEEVYPLLHIIEDETHGKILLSHYPMIDTGDHHPNRGAEIKKVFDREHCTWNIHGHTHSKRASDPRCLCVSVEQTGLCPVRLIDVLDQVGR